MGNKGKDRFLIGEGLIITHIEGEEPHLEEDLYQGEGTTTIIEEAREEGREQGAREGAQEAALVQVHQEVHLENSLYILNVVGYY